MPVPRHVRVRVGGTLYGDASWSVGLSLARPLDAVFPGQQVVTSDLDALRDHIRAYNGNNVLPDAIRKALSNQGDIRFIRVSQVGPDGKEELVSLVELTSPVLGVNGAAHQAQTAVVASLRTDRPGASYRGRLYWPCLGLDLTGGRLGDTDTLAIAQATSQWIVNCGNTLPGILETLGVVPAVISSTKNTATRIQQVAVGNRLDSQRRRAESEDEIYAVAAVPQ